MCETSSRLEENIALLTKTKCRKDGENSEVKSSVHEQIEEISDGEGQN